MSDDIPVEIISTEEREDGLYVTGRIPESAGEKLKELEGPSFEDFIGAIDDAREYRSPDFSVLTEMGEEFDKHFREIPHDRDVPKTLRNRGRLSMFDTYPTVETVRGPSRDRSLRGKARRKARKAD